MTKGGGMTRGNAEWLSKKQEAPAKEHEALAEGKVLR